MSKTLNQQQRLLKRALTGNAIFSILSGVTILIADRWLVTFLGLPDKVSLEVIGVGLILFAGVLWLNVRRPKIRIAGAWIAVIMDAAWVAGSYVLILVVPFTTAGKWTVALVAELVLAFAVLQWLGIRRLRKTEQYA
jgi:hypothetical protein